MRRENGKIICDYCDCLIEKKVGTTTSTNDMKTGKNVKK